MSSSEKKAEKKNDGQVVQEKDKSWFHGFWKSQEQIKKDAKNYDSIPWYLSPRYGAIALLVIQNFVGFITGLFGWADLFTAVAVYMPLYFLIARGYRIFIAFTLILYTINRFYDVVVLDYANVSLFFWWLATVYMLSVSYQIERARANLDKGKNETTYIRDAVISVLIMVGFAGAALFVNYKISSNNDDIMYWKGFIYRNTDGIKLYCGDAGIDLGNYVDSFNNQFSGEIAFIDNKLTERGINPDALFESINLNEGQVSNLITNHYDVLHTILVSFLVMEQTGISPEDFEWKDEYKDILPKAGFCSFIDLNPGLLQAIDTDFEVFSARVKQLQEAK